MIQLAVIFVLCFSPSLFWLAYFFYRGHYGRRHAAPLLTVFLAGLVAGPLSLGVFQLLELSPFYSALTRIYEVGPSEQFAYCLFAIGPVEELAKFFMVWLVIYRRAEFATPLDGLVFSAACGLGFATVENWYYMLETDNVLWTRAVTLPFNHVLFSSFWGVGLSFAKFGTPPVRSQMVFIGITLSFVYHGLYDYILVAQSVPDILVLPLVLALWLWLTTAHVRIQGRRSMPFLSLFTRTPEQETTLDPDPAARSDADETGGPTTTP